MAKLPFVVAPRQEPVKVRVGSEVSGVIEIERKGFLTAGEKSFMQANTSNDLVLKNLLRMARSLASSKKIGVQEAYNLISHAIQNENDPESAEVWKEYGEEMNQTLSAMMKQEATARVLKAFCMLLYRVDADIELEDVLSQHEDLIEGLVDLYDKEEKKSTERLLSELGVDTEEEAQEAGVEELEKK